MRRAFTNSVLLCLVSLAVGCNKEDSAKVDAKVADAPVKSVALVEAEHPSHRDISEYLSETSRIMAEVQVEVLAKGTGHCLSLTVEVGDKVTEGQILAELDRAEMEAQVRQSRVNAAQQKIAYERAEGGRKEGIISPAESDNAKFSYEQAKASLEMQEVQLTYLTIRAPISGIVTQRNLQQGMLVSSGLSVFTIVDPASFVLPINVNERNLPRLRVGQVAYVSIDSVGDREFVAEVRRIDPSVDLQSSAIRVILDFKKEDDDYLRESAFARYRLVMDTRENALVVPKDAIIEDNTRRYVMVVADAPEPPEAEGGDGSGASASLSKSIAVRQEVVTGLEDSSHTEIVSGVSPENLVITLGQQTVNDGDAIAVTTVEDALESKTTMSADEALESARERKPDQDGASKEEDDGAGQL